MTAPASPIAAPSPGRRRGASASGVAPLPPDASAGSLRPQPRLATGRAALGGLLVALAALGVFASWSAASAPPTTTFAVVRADLPAGTVLGADDLAEVAIDLPDDVARGAVRDAGAAVGAVTLAPLVGGDLLQQSALVAPGIAPEPGQEVALTLDRAHALGGDLVPGETVDVLGTYGSGTEAWTEVLARAAVVVGVADAGDGALAAAGQTVVTLSVPDPADVLEAVHAQGAGTVTLVRTTRQPSDTPTGPDLHRPAVPPSPDVTTGGTS